MATTNKFNRTNMEKVNETQANQANELAGDDGKARIKIQTGKNLFWVLPPVGKSQYFLRYVNVHYKPLHACSRPDPVPDPKTGGKKLINPPNFKACPRCIRAWEKRSEVIDKGTAQEAMSPYQLLANKKFRSDMSTERGYIQAVNVRPFFKDSPAGLVPDTKLIKGYFQAFIDIMGGATPEEGVPEDIIEAAQAGPQPLALNVETAIAVELAYKKAYAESDEDPLFLPGEYLLSIERVEDGVVPNTDITKYKHYVDWLSSKILEKQGWAQAMKDLGSAFIDAVSDRSVDLLEQVDSEDLKERARGLIRLSEDEMLAYLKESGHTFDVQVPQSQQASQPAQASQEAGADSDDNDTSFNSTASPRKAKQRDLSSLREELKNKMADEDESED